MQRRYSLKAFCVDSVYFAAGSALMALGFYTFALNAHFSPGGITGVSLMVSYAVSAQYGIQLPIGMLTLVMNIPLALVCARIVGVGYTLKSLWAMVLNTVFIDFVFPLIPTYSGNPLLAGVFTGICVGAGLAIIYMRGASTGGSDFITMSIKKRHPHFSVGQITLVIDGVIILAGGFVFGNIDAVLYGIVSAFATTMAMDNILYGAGSSKLAIVITDHGAGIAAAIGAEVERGSTLVPATGAYTGTARDMLLCVCSKSEIYKVRTAARAIDPGSMIIITEASEVFGEGFEPPRLPGNEDPAPGTTPKGKPPGKKP